MDFDETRDLESVTDNELPVEEEISATVEEVTAAREEPAAQEPVFTEQPGTAYRGTGVGKKESPFADSPYYSYYQAPRTDPEPQPEPEPQTRPAYEPEYQPPRQKKQRRNSGKGPKRFLAAVLAIVLVASACGVTAWTVNERWEDETERMEDQFETQIEALQDQIEELGKTQSGTSVSGSPMSSDGSLTPSQVYSMNVNSVVAISNQTTTNVWGQVSETASSGSGFVLTEDGYIISNYHVVEGASRLTVITYMGDEYEAQLVGYDEMNDVSILKVEATDLDPVTIGSSDDLIVGDQVVAIGNPLGELTSSLTVGYISAKDRTINTDGSLINMMQTDAAINPGNSGGPLFNMKGEVIGITTAKYSGSTSSGASIEGIGFAIPIDDVMSMADDLMSYGYLKNQAYLGVSVMDLDSSTASMYSLPTGSYVQSVTEGSCAETAGIQPKDIIIAVGDYTVEGNTTLQSALRKFKAGDTTTITVYRSGQEIQLTITFDERPQDPDATQEQPQQSGEMPSDGSFEEWYNYFYPFFGGRG